MMSISTVSLLLLSTCVVLSAHVSSGAAVQSIARLDNFRTVTKDAPVQPVAGIDDFSVLFNFLNNAGERQEAAMPSPEETVEDSSEPTADDSPSPSPAIPSDTSTPTPSTAPTSPDGPSPTPSPEPVCIDASALAHLPAHALVFGAEHRTASVLCDAAGSCATPGHVVEFRGKGMMMRTYCDRHAACSRRVMQVNSPRMKPGMRISSKTNGLTYTALAARYETLAEEIVLKSLMRVGL